MASKWRLNRAEESSVQKEADAVKAERLNQGCSEQEAKEAHRQHVATRTQELKKAKADASKAKQAARSAGGKGAAAPPSLAAPSADVLQNNTDYYTKLMDSMSVIQGHPVFQRINEAMPLLITDDETKECGVQAVFEAEAAKIALARTGVYRAACNLFWLDLTSNSTPRVPLSYARVREWAQTVFGKGPRHFKDLILVAAPAADSDLLALRGSWKQVTPEELTHSTVFALADRITAGAGEEELRSWRSCLLSTPMMFSVLGNEDAIYWEAYDQRQRIVQSHDTIKRSARQWAHEIMAFKERKEQELGEALTSKRLQMLFKDGSKHTEARSTKIETGADNFVGKSYLQGSPTAASAVDFIKFRRQAVDFFLEVELARQGFRLEDLQLVKQHLANVEIYRQTVTAKPDADGVVASQWQAGLKVSSIKALKLMEDLLFGNSLNSAMIAVLKKNPTKPEPLELCEVETFSLRMRECTKEKDAETASEKALAGMSEEAEHAREDDECTKIAKGAIPATPSRYTKGSVEHFTATAAELLNIYCLLQPEPSTESALIKMISESPLSPSKVKGVPGKSAVLIYLDTQLIGESNKKPALRLPPIQPGLLQKLITCALKARGSSPVGKSTQVDTPIEGDMIVVNDGGRARDDQVLAPFKSARTRGSVSPHLEHWELSLIISQDSVKQKKRKSRGALNQVMKFHFITKDSLDKMVPERKHTKYPGSCRGNALAFVSLASTSQTWQATVEEKQAGGFELQQ
ncbi:unnamed protein product [Effrenium voratum]|nr:unnamed protein product [Effrenium voratum]